MFTLFLYWSYQSTGSHLLLKRSFRTFVRPLLSDFASLCDIPFIFYILFFLSLLVYLACGLSS
jgi:hypothetical protein